MFLAFLKKYRLVFLLISFSFYLIYLLFFYFIPTNKYVSLKKDNLTYVLLAENYHTPEILNGEVSIYRNDTLLSVNNFDNGTLHGEQKYYSPGSQNLVSIMRFSNGNLQDTSVFFLNDHVSKVHVYQLNHLVYECYFDKNDFPRIEFFYENEISNLFRFVYTNPVLGIIKFSPDHCLINDKFIEADLNLPFSITIGNTYYYIKRANKQVVVLQDLKGNILNLHTKM